MAKLKTPGVYVEEITKFPPSVAEVDTAIPAFIGYTAETVQEGKDLINKPLKISSFTEYEEIFGGPYMESFSVSVTGDDVKLHVPGPVPSYNMYYSLKLFFANGGGPCYITSSGSYADVSSVSKEQLEAGLAALEKMDEPTIIVFPDAPLLSSAAECYSLYDLALEQCATLKDRMLICDVYNGNKDLSVEELIDRTASAGPMGIEVGFRKGIGNENLKYGAVYFPWLETTYAPHYNEADIAVTGESIPHNTKLKRELPPDGDLEAETRSLFHIDEYLYGKAVAEIEKKKVVLPPSSAIAGVYVKTDKERGVWKAPANVALADVEKPLTTINDIQQEFFNVHDSGKSINAIRTFAGKGVLVWGARTLAGNDNEWCYVPVRRFFMMVEESAKKATAQFVFEPNDARTWTKVRAMIENFLSLQWRDGALAGSKDEEAFYVKVGLGQTMSAEDISEGRMIVEIGMAVIRPAEFIILKFAHKMQES